MKEKILFVDDDPNILEGYQRKLRQVLQVDVAQGGVEGLKRIASTGPYAVVIADMHMPAMNGIEFLAHVKETSPNTVRMMLTGNADIRTAIDAVNEGSIFRFLTKPCPSDLLGKALADGINQYRLVTAERVVVENTLNGTIELLVEVLSWVDPEMFGKVLQLRSAARAIGRLLKAADIWETELAILLSRIGNMAMPKAGSSEFRPGSADLPCPAQVGHDLLARIPRLEAVAKIVLYQNKHFDGTGYPEDGVAGSAIPLGARVFKVLADLAELEEEGVKKRDALALMQGRTGTYDPYVLDAAIALHVQPERAPAIGAIAASDARSSSLQVGDVVLSGVRACDDRLLIGPGETITEALLIRLRVYARLVGIQEPVKIKRASVSS